MSAISIAATRTASALRQRRGSLASSDAWRLAPLGLVLGVAIAVNWPTLDDYFHGDDYIAFVDLATKPTWQHIKEVITFKDNNFYWRPIGELYYMVMWWTVGLNEVGYHIASIAFFLATLVLLYAFCMQAGFGRAVAVGACAFLTLFPNHVVSVSWVTNAPRLIAVMFALASLVALQRGITRRSRHLELLAFLLFLVAGLADEVALSLAPLAALYSLAVDRAEPGWLRRAVLRGVPYALLLLALMPLQFMGTASDPGFNTLQIGWQMPEHLWALTSKLVWPSRDGIAFNEITSSQWTAGAVALGGFAVALAAGSNRLRFLVLWILLGLAPFTIWTMPIAPARYLYMAAVPLAIIASWTAVRALEGLRRTAPGFVAGSVPASSLVAAAGLVVLAFAGSIGASITQERDRAFARDTETYRILADGLREAAPEVPPGARIVIYYGIWTGFRIWPESVAKTIYKDRHVRLVNVPRGQVDATAGNRAAKDVVLFYTGKGFIRSAPLFTSNSNLR